MRLPLLAALTLALTATDAAGQSTRCTTETIGQQTYTRCSDGYRSTSERIGSQIYTRDNRGTRGTTESIGSTLYYRDNTATRATTERIGSTDYRTIRSNAGTGRVTEQRIGTTNYLSDSLPGQQRVSGSSTNIGSTLHSRYTITPPPTYIRPY
jgi:hypothetical protein